MRGLSALGWLRIVDGGDDLQAVLVQLRRVQADVVDDDDDLRVALARVEAELAGAARDDQADVAVRASRWPGPFPRPPRVISSASWGFRGRWSWALSYSRSMCS